MWRFLFASLAAIFLVACTTGTPSAPTVPPTPAPSIPTVPPQATLTRAQNATTVSPSPGQLATATSLPGTLSNGLETGLDDTAQARLRIANFVANSPNVDLYINGKVAVNGGQPQVNIPVGYVNGYLFLLPDTYSVAVVAAGKGPAEALVGPLDIPLEAGHRYTVALIGQLEDQSIKPLVIDETAAAQKARTSPGQNLLTFVNNIKGTNTLDWGVPDETQTSIPYGMSGVGQRFVGRHPGFVIYADGDPKNYIDGAPSDNNSENPGIDQLVGMWGSFSGGNFSDLGGGESQPTSDLAPLEFMRGFHDAAPEYDGRAVSFDTFLMALEKAGIGDLFSSGQPYLVLAPTDEAFAALPKEELRQFMDDPKAVADLLKNHIIEGYVPRGSLGKTPGALFDRTFTNLLGEQITIGSGFTVNGKEIGGFDSYFLANGTQLHPTAQVLVPSK